MSPNNAPNVTGDPSGFEQGEREPLSASDIINSPLDPTDRIGDLPTARQGVESVPIDAEISVAATKMMALDYSQLGVRNGPKKLRGMISWRTIARALLLSENATRVRDCIESPQIVGQDDSILKTIPVIAENDYVLVGQQNGPISGIITAADLSLKFQELTEPFLLLREIERHLRKILAASGLSPEQLQDAYNTDVGRRCIDGVQDLTLGECIRHFQQPETWDTLGLRNIDRREFVGPLVTINDIRNRVMHFRGGSVADNETGLLRKFAGMVRVIDEARAKGKC